MDFKSSTAFWGFVITCLNFFGVIIIGAFNIYSHNKIVGNDLHHLAMDLKDIKIEQKEQGNKINTVITDYASLSARCEERHAKK